MNSNARNASSRGENVLTFSPDIRMTLSYTLMTLSYILMTPENVAGLSYKLHQSDVPSGQTLMTSAHPGYHITGASATLDTLPCGNLILQITCHLYFLFLFLFPGGLLQVQLVGFVGPILNPWYPKPSSSKRSSIIRPSYLFSL
jgi:hypothetical protein